MNEVSEKLIPISQEVKNAIKEKQRKLDRLMDYFASLAEPGFLDNERLALLSPFFLDIKNNEEKASKLISTLEDDSLQISDTDTELDLRDIDGAITELEAFKVTLEDIVEIFRSNDVEEAIAAGQQISLVKTEDGYSVSIDDTEPVTVLETGVAETAAVVAAPLLAIEKDISPKASLAKLFAEGDERAILETDQDGSFRYKSPIQVVDELEAIFIEKGFTIDARERDILNDVQHALHNINNYQLYLTQSELPERVSTRYEALIALEAERVLTNVAAFLQTERRDEAVGVRSESLPEVGVSDVETKIAASLAEFELFEKSPAYSSLVDTSEYKKAAAAVTGARAYKNVGSDKKVESDIRRIHAAALEKSLHALLLKVEELGVEEIANDTPVLEEPVVVTNNSDEALKAKPEPVAAEDVPETIEGKMEKALMVGTEFIQSLPADFTEKGEINKIAELKKAMDDLVNGKNERNIVTKAILLGTFNTALVETRTLLDAWQTRIQNASNTSRPISRFKSEIDLLTQNKIAASVPAHINPDSIPTLTEVDTEDTANNSIKLEAEGLVEVTDALGGKDAAPELLNSEAVAYELVAKSEATPIFDKDENLVVDANVMPTEAAYAMYRTRSFEAKAAYREKEAEFNRALKEHYDSEGFWSRLRSSKKVLGINSDLPPALESLRQESRVARALYAESLDAVLRERSRQDYVKSVYDSESESTSIAFARKFILKPQEAQLAMQQRIIFGEQQAAIFKNVTETLAKHKWLVRAGVVAVAGISGGVVSGSWKATQIAASAYFGAAAAKNTHDYFAPQVAEANQNLADVTKGIAKSGFSVEHLISAGTDSDVAAAIDKVGGIYGDRLVARNKAVTKQKAATVGAAVLVGGVSGGLNNYMEAVSTDPALVSGGVYNVEATTAAEVAPVGVTEATPTSSSADFIMESARGPVAIESMSIAQYTPGGDIKPPLVLNNISFGPGSNIAAIPEEQKLLFIKEMRVLASDISPGGSHIPESKFEAMLFEKIQAKFGQASWWSEAKFSMVDVGNYPEQIAVETEPATTTFTPAEATPTVEVQPVVEEVSGGDTVSGIILEKLSGKFEGMSVVERGQIMDKLFERIDKNPEILKELGLRSDSIDLIYPDEKINLTVLERELDWEIEKENTIEQFKTGPVTVEVDSETKTVPIKVKAAVVPEAIKPSINQVAVTEVPTVKTVPESAFVKVSADSSMIKAKYEPIAFPKVTALNGQYLEHPDYIKLQNQVFEGNAKGFDKAISTAIERLDRDTYDFTDTIFGQSYQSPYNILNSMKLEDFEKFSAKPNADLRFELQQNNVKYETYLLWADLVQDMKKVMPYQATTTIGDMFGRMVLDDEVDKYNIKLKVRTA